MLRNRKGFTLIELLIVVVIIGILAAIAIPKFAATKDKAKLASVKTDVRNAITAEEAYFSDNAAYATFANLAAVGMLSLSTNNTMAITPTGGTSYTLTASNSTISTGTTACALQVGVGGSTASGDGVIHCP